MGPKSAAPSKPKTRKQSGSQLLRDFVGKGKELDATEVPTLRAVIQQGLFIKEKLIVEDEVFKEDISPRDLANQLSTLILSQWHKSNAKFCPPVVMTEISLLSKVEKLWKKVDDVARNRTTVKEKVEDLLDKLLDITTCPHTIML